MTQAGPATATPDERVESGPLRGLLETVFRDPATRRIAESADRSQLVVEGPVATRALTAAALAAEPHAGGGGAGRPALLVTATGREADEVATAVSDLLGPEGVATFPSWETLPHERLSPRADTVGRRLAVLRRLAHPEEDHRGPIRVLVTTVRSLIQPIAPDLGERAPVRLRLGEEHDFEQLVERLADLAYQRVDMVEKRGEFAVRGGIVDVFPPTEEHPLRVEFFGDEATEIRPFSVADQRSLPEAEQAELFAPACRELLLTDEVRDRAAKLAEQHEGDPQLTEMLGKLAGGVPVEGMESLIPALCAGQMRLLTELVPAGTHVLLADPEKVRARAADLVRTGQEFLEASWQVAGDGGGAPIDLGESAYRGLSEVAEHTASLGLPWWMLTQLSSGDVEDAEVVQLGVKQVEAYRGDFERAYGDLRAHVSSGGAAVVVVPGAGTAQRAVQQLGEAELPARQAEGGLPEQPAGGLVTVAQGSLEDGFAAPELALVVLTEADLTGARGGTSTRDMRRMPSRRRRNAVDPLALKPGDFVVHEQHGIGKYVEMTQRTVGGATREYLVLEYASSKRGQSGDRLFVPTDQLDEVSRYVGGETPSLNKLGGSDWKNTKAKARKAVKEIAAELVQLYAARQSAPGHAFAPDSPWQRELEDAFPHVETSDQLAAIDEVKSDMQSPVPMDRVICGDVGYGKTEIAVRAAFKAVQDGKQVAVLVPTTLLAQQHLSTFADRMRSFPVTIRGMSRFTHAGEAEETLTGLANGEVDVVIGTHRLLQTGVRYKNLGMVIVDEEQRFGVTHKERIKNLKKNVDVLTLTATPIPRTLHMSLVGIRDMSVLEEPPIDRVPIQTYVMEYNDELVREAINRELARNGQVYYVYNRVNNIADVAGHVQKLCPEARIAYAHGQMSETQLEDIMLRFINGEVNVLVSTTIIETGLDIPNANTMIIQDADRMGLSQLYQIRGRVGRSNRTAYAFLMYRRGKMLTEESEKRLKAIREFTQLGSGIRIAMRDLEIRGAGNVLGAEQHGHMEAVGYDLYCKLLNTAVKEEKGELQEQPSFDTQIDCDIDAFIPDTYIPNESQKLDVYKRISSIENEEDYSEMQDELIDRFGEIPKPCANLLRIALLRAEAHRSYATEVDIRKGSWKIQLDPKARIRVEEIPALVREQQGRLRFLSGRQATLVFRQSTREKAWTLLETMDDVEKTLRRLQLS